MKRLSKREWIAVVVGLVIISLFFFNRTFIFSFLTSPAEKRSAAATNSQPEIIVPEDIVRTQDIVSGTGKVAGVGTTVMVHYRGTLENGFEFDNSYRAQPIVFTLGVGQLIDGFENGILGMRAGGKRRVVIPPALGYGERGVPGVIPPNSTIIFEIELLEVK